LSTTARSLLPQAQENGVSTTLKIFSRPISGNCDPQAASPKSRLTNRKISPPLKIGLPQMRATIANHESPVTSHESRKPDEL
jgi:hypothetical protein